MAEVNMLVNDFLLKELSAETRKIGTKVVVRRTNETPAYTADIIDIIIMPHSDFYRIKFMAFYQLNQYNSVKALKELSRNFPYTPDYNLGIGYILNQQPLAGSVQPYGSIRLKSEIDLPETSSQPDEVKVYWKKPTSGFM
jgi:hypothetical protein